jgi:hypothetical protein
MLSYYENFYLDLDFRKSNNIQIEIIGTYHK